MIIMYVEDDLVIFYDFGLKVSIIILVYYYLCILYVVLEIVYLFVLKIRYIIIMNIVNLIFKI